MREFSKISPAVWHSPRFNGLPSQDGRYLYLYLLTSPHQTSAGAYSLPEGYACADLQWPKEKYCAARDELIAADLIDFDAKTEVVLIKRWFKHNPPMNQKHLQGILKLLDRLPSPRLQEAALVDVQEALKAREDTTSTLTDEWWRVQPGCSTPPISMVDSVKPHTVSRPYAYSIDIQRQIRRLRQKSRPKQDQYLYMRGESREGRTWL